MRGLRLQHPGPPRPRGWDELPASARRAGDDRRLDPYSLVGDRRVHAGHLDGIDPDALPERERVPLVPCPPGRGSEQTRSLAGQIHAGGRPDAEIPEVLVLDARADVL